MKLASPAKKALLFFKKEELFTLLKTGTFHLALTVELFYRMKVAVFLLAFCELRLILDFFISNMIS